MRTLSKAELTKVIDAHLAARFPQGSERGRQRMVEEFVYDLSCTPDAEEELIDILVEANSPAGLSALLDLIADEPEGGRIEQLIELSISNRTATIEYSVNEYFPDDYAALHQKIKGMKAAFDAWQARRAMRVVMRGQARDEG